MIPNADLGFSKENTLIVFAVFTKRFGIAVFNHECLLYFAVKTIRACGVKRSVQTQISQPVENLVSEFDPQLVLVKTLTRQQKSSEKLRFVLRQIKREINRHEISAKDISLELVKKKLCADTKPTKANLFTTLAETYPELKRLIRFQNLSQAEYYNSLLSAVAIGYFWNTRNIKLPRKHDKEEFQ